MAGRLLITADAGGSNGYRTRTWRTELARFAAETGLAITVCHLSADAVAPGRVPAQAIGRWGNRFNQELYGRRSVTRVDTPCGTVRGRTGGLPGYSSEVCTDATGTRSVAVFTITDFGMKERKAATANKALVDAATCQMLGNPQPSNRTTA